MNRRQALKLLAAGGAAGGAYLVLKTIEGAFSLGREGRLVSRTFMGMGTYVTLTTVDPSEDRAEEAMARARAEMERLEALLTRFSPDAPLGRLRRLGRLDPAPAELLAVLGLAEKARQATGGAFDVTVAPLLALYQDSLAQGRVPDAADIRQALDLVGADKMRLGERGVRLERAGMALTLDGVAKGWIVDAMAEALRQAGLSRGLVNAGGDIRAFGGREAGQPWQIAVRDPGSTSGLAETFALTNGACATSGDYEVHYDQDKLFHHIVDPASGRSPRGFASATVAAATAAQADALSTSLLVLGEKGLKVLRPHASRLLLIGQDGQMSRA